MRKSSLVKSSMLMRAGPGAEDSGPGGADAVPVALVDAALVLLSPPLPLAGEGWGEGGAEVVSDSFEDSIMASICLGSIRVNKAEYDCTLRFCK